MKTVVQRWDFPSWFNGHSALGDFATRRTCGIGVPAVCRALLPMVLDMGFIRGLRHGRLEGDGMGLALQASGTKPGRAAGIRSRRGERKPLKKKRVMRPSESPSYHRILIRVSKGSTFGVPKVRRHGESRRP